MYKNIAVPSYASDKEISEGDVLVVPATGNLYVPAFFKVVGIGGRGRLVKAEALGSARLDDGGEYVPVEGQRVYSLRKRIRSVVPDDGDSSTYSYINTWCGKAFVWNGAPMRDDVASRGVVL